MVHFSGKVIMIIFILLFSVCGSLIVLRGNAANSSGKIYIKDDGTIDPPTAPINRTGDTYVLTADILSEKYGIVINRSNIILDGASHTLEGSQEKGQGIALGWDGRISNITIMNLTITHFEEGIELLRAEATIKGNTIAENSDGIRIDTGSQATCSANNIVGNNAGVDLDMSMGNLFFNNNFINNSAQVYAVVYSASWNTWDSGYPDGGNYWSNYNGTDENSGKYQNETGPDGIGDTPYKDDTLQFMDVSEEPMGLRDNYPLMNPYTQSQDTSDTSISPLWCGTGSDWRIYQRTPQNPNGTPLTLDQLLQGWQDDINDYQAKYPFNSIRLAFSFADSGENLTHNVLNMTELDDVLQLFSSNSIKVILDLHNWDDPVRNVTDMPGFFGSSKWIADWKDVASRYKDDTEILAYEIFNEPSSAFGTWDPSVTGGGCGIPYNGTGKSVTMALAECVDAIRSVGDSHPIIYPDPHYFTVANDETDPEQFFNSADSRQNIVITFHDWFQNEAESVFQASWNNSIKLQKSWESYYPIWIGEFGVFDNSSFQTEVNSEIIKWALDNQVGFNMFVARSNPTAREEQWNMSGNALTVPEVHFALVIFCFGSAPGCPPPYTWNANYDVNNDGKIDGKDIALVALHYGQAGP